MADSADPLKLPTNGVKSDGAPRELESKGDGGERRAAAYAEQRST